MKALSFPFCVASITKTAVCFIVLVPLVFSGPVRAQSCLSAADTRSAIAAGQIVRFSQIASVANANGYSQLGSASVCGSPGNYVYVVVASTPRGDSARLTFNAISGALLSAR